MWQGREKTHIRGGGLDWTLRLDFLLLRVVFPPVLFSYTDGESSRVAFIVVFVVSTRSTIY